MQIVGIDLDEKWIRCGRIQNVEKPEFVKLKQFSADNKGAAGLEKWLDECCAQNRADLTISLMVNDATGASLANRLYLRGFPISPVTASHAFKHFRLSRGRKPLAEIIAALAIEHPQHWRPMSQPCLELRSALFEREIARVNCQQNQARNESFSGQAFDFLMQLTQNAANIHADRIDAAEDDIEDIIEKTPEFKRDLALLETIPGMTPLAAQALVCFIHAYPAESPRQLSECLGLTSGKRLSLNDYRMHDLRIVRGPLYAVAKTALQEIPAIKDLGLRMIQRRKSPKTIIIAAMHKVVILAYTLIKNQTEYRS